MSVAVEIVAVAIVLLGLLAGFLMADAGAIAGGARFALPAGLAVLGLAVVSAGNVSTGVPLLCGGAVWLAAAQFFRHRRSVFSGKRSLVRTAALEMELDHDTGGLEGQVLAGRHEGRLLGRMSREALLHLRREVSSDPESRQLLEAYLDSRFPVWRKDFDPDMRDRQRGTPCPGAMTKQEAYKVLGLESGASSAEIRQAHRRLMQRVHPDIGSSPILAARINEAKDVLLSDHD